MEKTYIVRLYFKNAIHIGASNPGIGIEGTEGMIIHSDTLWAALCNNWAVAEHALDIPFREFRDSFINGNPLFRISSAFPMTHKGKYWLPKPISDPYEFCLPDEDDRNEMKMDYGKMLKRTSFISLESFRTWIDFEEGALEIIEKESLNEGFSDDIRPHNTLNRTSMDSQIYHSGTTYFDKDETGVYFLLQTTEQVKDIIQKLLYIIKDTAGIGGNRGIGMGTIDMVNIEEADDNWDFLDETEDRNAYCTLSLFYPEKNEEYLNSAHAYNLILRKGWTGSLSVGRQVKRKTVHMFGEGSIFLEEPNGQLVDLTPDKKTTPLWNGHHEIYRYGYALTVPIKLCQEEEIENE